MVNVYTFFLVQLDTIGHNPQYYIAIRGDDPQASYAVVIGLMQKNRRLYGEDEVPLEINIYSVRISKIYINF